MSNLKQSPLPSNTDFFTKLENTNPFIKVAFEGFPKSGKTFTASMLAIGLHKKIKSTKPIVVYDTERSFKALKGLFQENKIEVLTRESRSLADLTKTLKVCEEGEADIVIIDSITHVWESYIEAYKEQKNRTSLQFQDWGVLKPKWKKEFSNPFVQSRLHIIFTGRAGYEYDTIINEQGRKEIEKSGIKMKAETEQAYEPDMLILMQRFQDTIGEDKKAYREATILGDRTDTIDGKIFKNPTYADFAPAVDKYLNGTIKDNELKETTDKFPEEEYDNKKTYRTIALEKIEGIMTQLIPGRSAKENKLKIDILETVFATRSWKEIEISSIDKLNEGNEILNVFKQDLERQVKLDKEEGRETTAEKTMEILQEAVSIGLNNFADLKKKQNGVPEEKEKQLAF